MKNEKNLTRGVDLVYLWFYQASDKRPFAERRQRNEAQTERTSVEQSRDSKQKESCKADRKQRGGSVNRGSEKLHPPSGDESDRIRAEGEALRGGTEAASQNNRNLAQTGSYGIRGVNGNSTAQDGFPLCFICESIE